MNAITDLFSQYGKPLATITNIVLVILMSLSAAQGVLFVIDKLNTPAASTDGAQNFQVTPVRQSFGLAELNLFGVANQAAPRPETVPETSLNLELQGVFTAEDPKDSTAIVSQRGQSGSLYRVGERLPGNAILEEVYDDHILIKRGNRIEKLAFIDAPTRGVTRVSQGDDEDFDSQESYQEAGNTRLEQINERLAERTAQLQQSRSQGGNRASSNIREQLTEFQARFEEDPSQVLSDLGVEAVSDSEAGGYRLGGEIPDAILKQSGLQQGDTIISVNGQAVGDVMNDSAVINQVMDSGRARVEVQRGERRFVVTVPIPKS